MANSFSLKFDEIFVQLFGWFETDKQVFLAMEYFKEGDLQSHMRDGIGITEHDTKAIAAQLLEGLSIMHKEGFAHRDLKPQNIFVVESKPSWWIKIGDFGITKRIQNDDTVLKTEIGTREFLAPEVLGYVDEEAWVYTNAVDMWSLGCIMYRMITAASPFPNPRILATYCRGRQELPTEALRNANASQKSIDFIRQLLLAQPSQRPKADTALSSAWFEKTIPSVGKELEASDLSGAAVKHLKNDNESPNHASLLPKATLNRWWLTDQDKKIPFAAVQSVVSGDRLHAQHELQASKYSSAKMLEDTNTGVAGISINIPPPTEVGPTPKIQNVQTTSLPLRPPPLPPRPRQSTSHGIKLSTLNDNVRKGPLVVKKESKPNEASPQLKPKQIRSERSPQPVKAVGNGNSEEIGPWRERVHVLFNPAVQPKSCLKSTPPFRPGTPPGRLEQPKPQESHRVNQKKVPTPEPDKAKSAASNATLKAIDTMCTAVEKGDQARVKYLMQTGVSIDGLGTEGRNPLHCAAIHGHESIMELFLQNGANVEARSKSPWGWTALLFAAEAGNTDLVTYLVLQCNADITAKSDFGETAMHRAATNEHGAVTSLLIQQGADVNATTDYGYTPLYRAVTEGLLFSVQRLLENGAKIDPTTLPGRTALHYAAEYGEDAIARLLLEKGANINQKDNGGNTALHKAAKNGHVIMIRILLAHGAQNDLKNGANRTALDCAIKENHTTAVKILSPVNKMYGLPLNTLAELQSKPSVSPPEAKGNRFPVLNQWKKDKNGSWVPGTVGLTPTVRF